MIDARDVPLGRMLGPKMEVREVLGVAVVEEAADRALRAAPPVEEIELGLGVVGLVGDFVGDFGRPHQYTDEFRGMSCSTYRKSRGQRPSCTRRRTSIVDAPPFLCCWIHHTSSPGGTT